MAAIVVAGRGESGRLTGLFGNDAAGGRKPPAGLVPVAVAAGTACAAADVSPSLAGVAGVTAIGVWWLRRRRHAERARLACRHGAVELTFALAGELRAGRTPTEALRACCDTSPALRGVVLAALTATERGMSGAHALQSALTDPSAARLLPVAQAWGVAESAGGQVALVLERIGAAMDAEDEIGRELDAAMAGPKATVVVLAALPGLGIVLGETVGAHPVGLLVHRPIGWALVGGAVLLDLLGVLVMRRITRWVTRP
jgi:tight adherence protein B